MASNPVHALASTDIITDHHSLYEKANALYGQAIQSGNVDVLDEAQTLAFQAQALRPDYLPGLNLLSRIELQRQHYSAAEFWVEQGLRYKPNSTALLYSAGHIALIQGDLTRAEYYFTESAKISRVATKAVVSLAHVKLLQGDFVEAFRHYRELIKTNAHDIQIRSKLFEATSHIVADFYAEELEADLLRYLDFTDVDHSLLRPLATSLLRHKLRLSEAGCPLELDTIASDTLLLKCLTRFYFTDPIFERLFITIRQALLNSCSTNLAIARNVLPLVNAIGQQCWLNESVWYINEQEHNLVSQLETLCDKLLQLPSLKSEDIYPALSLVLMYKPLQNCTFYEQLANTSLSWPELVHDFINAQLTETKALAHYHNELFSFGNSDDEVSARVQNQYNRHPYPRWTAIGYNQPANYALSLRQTFASFADVLPEPDRALNTLVAGCGTGRHAIRLAKYFPSLNITAIDLSSSALAYANNKATAYKVDNIQFLQGNILNIRALNQQFDVIECSGVLHHMHSPVEGLKALTGQLKQGGVIKIALYSATARKRVSELRHLLGSDIPNTENNIRLVREALLQKSLTGDWNDFYKSDDFYSLSACRDLIFHQQEHVFDVLELVPFLQEANLTWMGMLPPESSQGLLALTGKHASNLSVEEWHQLEQSNPDLFAGMYQFYAIKL